MFDQDRDSLRQVWFAQSRSTTFHERTVASPYKKQPVSMADPGPRSVRGSGVREEMLFMDRRGENGDSGTMTGGSDGAVTDREAEWSPSHLRLLYLLSRFTTYPSSTDEEEKWLRSLPLLVMVYEAIVHGLLAFDYSPVCTSIVKDGQSRRLWLNLSQDAKAAIDDLRECELVKALKTCSEDFQPSTAYQVTARASAVLQTLPLRDKKLLDAFLADPGTPPQTPRPPPSASDAQHTISPRDENPSGLVLAENALLKLTYSASRGEFSFERSDGSLYVSQVTVIEQVSYVSSPYLPPCLMHNDVATFSSNASQAEKCYHSTAGVASSSIQDAELSFAIVLENVRLMVGEWIPYGPNQIVSLNDRLGSLERCQGGLFTSELDDAPTSTSLHVCPGLTKIAIVDFEFDAFTNFEADIHAPQEDGVVQIESFGMHLNGDGSIVYGMVIEATMDRPADFLCVDHLARLLVDVDLDSSKIINDLLSPHQRALLDMLFMNDARSRNKFALLTASSISPKLPARAYLDRGEKENELKQVLGEIYAVHDLGTDDKLLIGRDGMLLAGPNSTRHESLLVAYLALLSRELVVRFFFKRTFILGDLLSRARSYMKSYEMNPEALDTMRQSVSQCAHDLVMLEEILELLRESLRSLSQTLPQRPTPSDKDPSGCGAALYDHLQLRKTHTDLEIRCKDLAKLLRGFRAKLKQVQSQNGTMSKTMLEGLVLGVERNVAVLADVTRASQRSLSSSFDVLLALFTGFLAFELLDRVTDGDLLGIDGASAPTMEWVNEMLVKHLLAYPGIWFLVDLLSMLFIAMLLHAVVRIATRRLSRIQRVSFADEPQRINVVALEAFLQEPISSVRLTAPGGTTTTDNMMASRGKRKFIESRTANTRGSTRVVKVVWSEAATPPKCRTWLELLKHLAHDWEVFIPPPVRTQLTFDATHSLLLDVTFHAGLKTDCYKLLDELMAQLDSAGCFKENYTPACVTKPEGSPRSRSRHGLLARSLARRKAPVHPTQEM